MPESESPAISETPPDVVPPLDPRTDDIRTNDPRVFQVGLAALALLALLIGLYVL